MKPVYYSKLFCETIAVRAPKSHSMKASQQQKGQGERLQESMVHLWTNKTLSSFKNEHGDTLNRRTIHLKSDYNLTRPNHQRVRTYDLQSITIETFYKRNQPNSYSRRYKDYFPAKGHLRTDSVYHQGKSMNNDKTKEECFDKQSFTHGGHEMFEHYSINHLVKDKLANESKNRQKIMTLIKGVNVKEGCLEQLQDNLARMKKMVEQRLKNCSYEVSSMKNPEERLIGTKMSTKDSFHEKEELGTFLKKMIFRKERYEEADTEKINAVLNNYHRLTSSFIGMTECLNTYLYKQKTRWQHQKEKYYGKILQKMQYLYYKNNRMVNLINQMKQKGVDVDSFWGEKTLN